MTPILSTLKKSGRAAVVALALGAASVGAMPAMAQAPSFNFNLDLGTGGSNTFSFGAESERSHRGGRWDRDYRRICLTDRHIRSGLRDEGFRDIEIIRELRRDRVEVEARYGRSWYLLRVDRCTGHVQVIERIRRGRPGFGLQFNFGN